MAAAVDGADNGDLMTSLCLIQLLEYIGRGKSIIDVGLAQARHPLTTRYHYFELQIVDPGENCYVAIGVARRVGYCSCSCCIVESFRHCVAV